ncbi:MAG: QueT transporter family protein [Eubacteriales bacterium]|nr:QueT transporter family protein [Eubacteriales bacterium]MDD3349838.1 QueT transporter family protein [Eubacteriales bacterium]
MKSTKFLVQAALIAALYAGLTLFPLLRPFNYGVLQIRVSEVLTILPAFTPAAIPGLFIGCFVANMLGDNGPADMLIGSAATLIAAFASYKLRKNIYLVPLPPVIVNGLLVGAMLYYVYGVPFSLPACIFWVALGEAVACYALGLPLLKYFKKRESIFRL